ncbi:hypothetical protein A2609_01105 [Candidatus Kaiserbacteria bacterium RIFOXYD1_FULL_47_14]|uniref:Aminoglycoside phosphotransferase domain-containing protein n=1 Tax=Candidatus Kaiserbacteria bacterium RIFOXYD1_FULL_47_14 TaxID=1798533 RepID=A0A1F6G6T6_9BACT|nr:MAG: hypothetical protein A2609_01105 [Candidatus Kaiserbacteria bacterium RIFOXYD1_FULL_47_14]
MEEISKALKEYPLIEDSPINVIRESADNIVFVVGENDKKILRISKRLATKDIAFEYEAVNYLAQNGVPVARWLTTKTGSICTLADDRVAVLFDFLTGYHITVDKDHLPTRGQCYQAGIGLGLMSNAASKFTSKSPRARNIFSELERVVALEEMFTRDFDGGTEFVAQVREALEFGRAQDEIIGFIHNDYRPSNVFFGEDTQVTGIIDFDWSCIGPVIKDLALAIVEWSFPDGAKEADLTLFQAFLDGYNSISNHKFSKDDKLYSWIKFSTLSDASTYFCDLAEDSASTKRVIKSYMYQKFLFFSQF